MTHRVELTFDDGVYAKLICPEGGCPAPNTCSECGRHVDDPEDAPRCYACVQDETECWVKTWFDNLTATELLAGVVTVTIEPEWEHDSLTARIVPAPAPVPPDGEPHADDIIRRLRLVQTDHWHAAWVPLDQAEACIREAFAAGRAAATPDPPESRVLADIDMGDDDYEAEARLGIDGAYTCSGCDTIHVPAASPDERLREAVRDFLDGVFEGDGRWDRLHAALAAADREKPDEPKEKP